MRGISEDQRDLVASLPTPVLADAVVRLALPVRQAPPGIRLPVFSYGTAPFGPTELRPPFADRFTCARFGEATVTRADIVVADRNGVVFLPGDELDSSARTTASIREAETEQIKRLQAGTSLREQFDFDGYLRDRERDPARTFRQHLRERGRAVEE